MKNKKHLAVGKRGISLTALALAACMLLTLAGSEIGRAKAVNLEDGGCSLEVTLGTDEDLAKENVVIDLYKVADAEAVSGYDTYTLKPTGVYANVESIKTSLGDMTKLANEDYKAMAQAAAAYTFQTSGVSVAKTVDGSQAGSEISRLDSGLYLLVARGADMDKPVDYVTTVTDEEGQETLATIAYSDTYTYTFAPELIALPSKPANADGDVMTSNPEDWLYDLSVTLKSERTLRFGDLEIRKNLPTYAADEPSTFLFRVNAYKDNPDGQLLYSAVHAIPFSDAGTNSITIKGVIPVGAYVEVTEEYSGPAYRVQGDATQTVTIPASDEGDFASVTFTNIYQGGTTTSGGAITNHFEYNAEGGNAGWNWTQQ